MARTRDLSSFLDYVRGECAHAGVQLVLDPRARTKEGMLGSFDFENKKLTCCVSNPLWLGVLAHELSHLHQWVKQTPIWVKSVEEDSDSVYEEWMNGKDLSASALNKTIKNIQACEQDAERRALKLIKDYGLVDPQIYTRSANMYVWKYEFARRHRKWVRTDHLDSGTFKDVVPDSQLINARSFKKLPEALEQMLWALLSTPKE